MLNPLTLTTKIALPMNSKMPVAPHKHLEVLQYSFNLMRQFRAEMLHLHKRGSVLDLRGH